LKPVVLLDNENVGLRVSVGWVATMVLALVLALK